MKDVLIWIGTHATFVWLALWSVALGSLYLVQCVT